MMRITASRGEGEVVRLTVEGRLTAATIDELETTCDAAWRGGLTAMLDLAGVQFADEAGIGCLARLRERGAVVIGCSGFLSTLLHEHATAGSDEAGDDPSEGWLIERLRRGDGDAYEEVIRRHGSRMLATARRMLRSDDAAEDAVQEAMLSAFRHIGQFAGTAKLSTWLHRIVVNVALMRMRSGRARPETSVEDLLPRFESDGHWADRIGGWEESGETLLGRGQTRILVRQCIDQLPATHRTVLLLRDIEELDTEETALRLGITPNAVKIRLHRARQALRTLLERALRPGEQAVETFVA